MLVAEREAYFASIACTEKEDLSVLHFFLPFCTGRARGSARVSEGERARRSINIFFVQSSRDFLCALTLGFAVPLPPRKKNKNSLLSVAPSWNFLFYFYSRNIFHFARLGLILIKFVYHKTRGVAFKIKSETKTHSSYRATCRSCLCLFLSSVRRFQLKGVLALGDDWLSTRVCETTSFTYDWETFVMFSIIDCTLRIRFV